jgi:hypothetical protein
MTLDKQLDGGLHFNDMADSTGANARHAHWVTQALARATSPASVTHSADNGSGRVGGAAPTSG